jgi:hypothetical protein
VSQITFIGATTTDEFSVASGSTASGMEDIGSGGTRSDVPPTRPSITTVDPVGLSDWINSAEAAPYQGKWVLLSDGLDVLDADESPGAILDRHSDVTSPTIVFVQPRGRLQAV